MPQKNRILHTDADFHMHSTFSDGSAAISEMAHAAIEKGLEQIAVTDHMPLPFQTRYAMAENDIHTYRSTIKNAQTECDGRLKIHMGIEIEFIPDLIPWIHAISTRGWDIQIASIHRLKTRSGEYHMVNGTKNEFDRLQRGFDMDIRALYRAYFSTARQAYETGWFNIAGHLDVLKKHNCDNLYFDEFESDYQMQVLQTLEVIKNKKMILEVNTAGFNQPIRAPYPSPWITDCASDMGIPIVLSSDSHCPESLGQHFSRFEVRVPLKVD